MGDFSNQDAPPTVVPEFEFLLPLLEKALTNRGGAYNQGQQQLLRGGDLPDMQPLSDMLMSAFSPSADIMREQGIADIYESSNVSGIPITSTSTAGSVEDLLSGINASLMSQVGQGTSNALPSLINAGIQGPSAAVGNALGLLSEIPVFSPSYSPGTGAGAMNMAGNLGSAYLANRGGGGGKGGGSGGGKGAAGGESVAPQTFSGGAEPTTEVLSSNSASGGGGKGQWFPGGGGDNGAEDLFQRPGELMELFGRLSDLPGDSGVLTPYRSSPNV